MTGSDETDKRMTDEEQVVRALEEHLHALLPECTVVDRGLEVEEGPSAHLVCTDSEGRLHLVVVVEGGAQETVLLALDTTSFLRRHADTLARHVGANSNPALQPRLVLVAEHFSPRAAARLAPLMSDDEESLRMCELRSLRSESGEALWFAPVYPSAEEAGMPLVTLASFIERLPESQQGIARAFGADLQRADPGIRCEVKRNRVQWWLGGAEVCCLRWSGGSLSIEFEEGEVLELESSADRMAALDSVMERVLEHVVEEVAETPRSDKIVMAETVPLLTSEELEAFREP